tara:strand:+ start:49 stop:294 length:246 start_codon:yes stop_codon:yes gene_type:complete
MAEGTIGVANQDARRFASRKFAYATALSALSTMALVTNKATMLHWMEINRFLFMTYVAGNVVQKGFGSEAQTRGWYKLFDS